MSLQGQERIWNSLLARRLALEFVKVEGVLRFGHFVPGSFEPTVLPTLQSGLWGSDADGGGPTPSSAPLHLFTSSTDIGALVLRL